MKNGLKILFDTYWNSNGWKDGTISNEDFELAKKEGYMFDYPKVISHEESLNKLRGIVKQVNPGDVANAFLYSLTTRKLEYRSALGSYWYAVSIPDHEFDFGTKQTGNKFCYSCGWRKWMDIPNDYELKNGINVYNFERFKFGGVRHTKLSYALFDLEQFLKLPKVVPTKEDKMILNKLLKCVEKLNENDKVGKLRKLILHEKIFKTNKNEVDNILNILGICGILASEEYPCYEEKFVDEYSSGPVEYKNDFAYPVNRWYARDGININRFEKVFLYKYK